MLLLTALFYGSLQMKHSLHFEIRFHLQQFLFIIFHYSIALFNDKRLTRSKQVSILAIIIVVRHHIRTLCTFIQLSNWICKFIMFSSAIDVNFGYLSRCEKWCRWRSSQPYRFLQSFYSLKNQNQIIYIELRAAAR